MSNENCEYRNDGERITAPGKFEGEPVFAPHFWGIGLDGFADGDNGKVFLFRVSQEDKTAWYWPVLKKWLGRCRSFRMVEDDQGFVHCF